MLGVDYWDLITLPLIGEIHLAWMGVPLTLMWLVGLTNAYNFMDGIEVLREAVVIANHLGSGRGSQRIIPVSD